MSTKQTRTGQTNEYRIRLSIRKVDNKIFKIILESGMHCKMHVPFGKRLFLGTGAVDFHFINATSPAQEAVLVTTPEITAIRDADRVAGLLEAQGISDVKLLVNRVKPEMIQKNHMMSVRDVQEMLGIPLLGAIPEDNHVIVSTNRGEPLVVKRKLTLSGIAFENAARRLAGKQKYLFEPPNSWWQTLFTRF